MNDTQHIDNAFVLEDLEQFLYLRRSISVHTSVRRLYLAIEFDKSVLSHCIDSGYFITCHWNTVHLAAYHGKSLYELIEV